MTTLIVNGYKIVFNSFWNEYQCTHLTSDEVGMFAFKELDEAIEYCKKG